jgi:transposase
MNKKRTRNVDWKEKRRYRAVELKHAGWTHEEIAEALDVSTRAVKQWMKVVREEGKAGLQAHPQPLTVHITLSIAHRSFYVDA